MTAKGLATKNENPLPAPYLSSPPEERALRLETALRRSEKLAMAGRLAAAVMHEINNPAQAIGDLTYLIQKEADNPGLVRARAAQIQEQLLRIQYVAGQTLTFFRDAPLTQKKDLVPLVEAALRYHARLLEEKKIEVRKRLPDQLIGSVFPGDLLQLLSNFVRNAAEAVPQGGILCIRLRACGANFHLTIADNGKGIPQRIQEHLFEAFQSDKAEAGNGLGLWICKTIVDKHQGKIYWRSSTQGKGHGTTFLVSLPFAGPVSV